MKILDRTYALRWGLLVLGITGGTLAASFVDNLHHRPDRSVPVHAERPDRPRPPLVVPTNVLLPAAPLDFSTALLAQSDTLSSSEGEQTEAVEASSLSAVEGTALVDSIFGKAASKETELSPVSGTPTSASVAPDLEATRASGSSSAQRTTRTPVARAQQPQTTSVPHPAPTASVGLGGLVIDETMTPHGRTFYTEFYSVWRSPPVNGFYTIKVQETPTPGRGTLVQVFVNDDVIFQVRLQPQTDIAEQALQAARRTYGYVRSGRGILRIY